GVTSNTIAAWLSVLQASYIITMLPPYFENTNKRLTKTPKLYFNDTGLACYLLGIETPQQLSRDRMRGHLFENLIITEALKHRFNQGKDNNLYFYRDAKKNEVDLLVKNGSDFTAIEIKSAQTYNTDFEKGLKAIDTILKDRIADKYIVYAGELENTTGQIKLIHYSKLNNIFP
ncbi:MAG TPA: AAA family ATPase, partial [Bacteroides graminisolvens]|nr:AAA family ATPase [Bacteroides graminisolvens]